MTKFGDVISRARAAKDDANQKAGETENQNAVKPVDRKEQPEAVATADAALPADEELEPFVNLSVRVPKRLRQHWAAEAKRSGTTLTKVISDALLERFGEP